jgi:hypothetical protein
VSKTVLVWARVFDGLCDRLAGSAEILIEDEAISDIAPSVGRPAARLSLNTVTPALKWRRGGNCRLIVRLLFNRLRPNMLRRSNADCSRQLLNRWAETL